MHAPERRHSASRRTLFARLFVVVCLISCFPLISASAAAQDYGHMRVQLSHGAAWTDTAPRQDSCCCRPVRPMPVTAMPIMPKSGAPNDRVRLKASNFNGM